MHYHFIGIKGSGMASLATIVADRGDEVSGSDIAKYIFTQKPLEERGIVIHEFVKIPLLSSEMLLMKAIQR